MRDHILVMSAIGRWLYVPDSGQTVGKGDWKVVGKVELPTALVTVHHANKEGLRRNDGFQIAVRPNPRKSRPSLEVLVDDEGKTTVFITTEDGEKVVECGRLKGFPGKLAGKGTRA